MSSEQLAKKLDFQMLIQGRPQNPKNEEEKDLMSKFFNKQIVL